MKQVSGHLFNARCFKKIGKIVDNSGLSEGFLNNLRRSKRRRRKKIKNQQRYDFKKKLSFIKYQKPREIRIAKLPLVNEEDNEMESDYEM